MKIQLRISSQSLLKITLRRLVIFHSFNKKKRYGTTSFQLISIWRTQCQSVNRRVFGTVAIPCDSEEYGVVVQSASTSYDNCGLFSFSVLKEFILGLQGQIFMGKELYTIFT